MGATLAETMHETLTADATFAAILAGGLYLVDEPDDAAVGAGAEQHPINPTDTPTAYTTVVGGSVKRLKPCGVVTTSTENTVQRGEGRQTFVHLYFYDDLGYAKTRAARQRARVLLHNRRVLVGSKGVELYHENDLTNSADDSLLGGDGKRPCSMERSVYQGVGRW